ncbi:MAG TPA: hypothetical protein VGO80_11030 [Solirubrobacteraceae bacterium]|jgi:hypothetical protein|nr:hypothetical protein [Solirubrobacteraceae bacterium]
MSSTDSARTVAQALLTLVMAGSTDARTNVAVDLEEIAAVTGLALDVVERELAALVDAGAGDWT